MKIVKCPKCGEEIKSLVLDVVELVRYKEVVFDDSGRLVLSPEREIYDRRQYMYRCPRCKKLITYYSTDALKFLKGESIRIPEETYFRLIV